MRVLAASLLLLTACATHRTGNVVAPEDMKYVASNADQGYTPKGHYTCGMESTTGSNMKVRVCRYDTNSQGDSASRDMQRNAMNQNSLSGTPMKGH
ncbi:MAG TPA: hypothetical protein VLW85_03535 [Myxococcales bacterium]|nr:hypothetical protein [Myxococcales bacterium]